MTNRTVLRILAVGSIVVSLMLAGEAAIAADEQAPIQVQVKAEIYKTTRDAIKAGEKKLHAEGISQPIFIEPKDIESVRTTLKDLGANLIGSPIISTINNTVALLQIYSSTDKPSDQDSIEPIKAEIIPRVNTDNTITLFYTLTIPAVAKDSSNKIKTISHAIATTVRMDAGDSVLCYDIVDETGDALLVIVTPTIVPNSLK